MSQNYEGVVQPAVEECLCEGWRLWYIDGPIEVCWCGHPRQEHGEIVCLGWVERWPALVGDRDV